LYHYYPKHNLKLWRAAATGYMPKNQIYFVAWCLGFWLSLGN